MSVSWQTLNPALLALFTALGRDEQTAIGPQVEHADRPRKMVDPIAGKTLTMRVLSVRGLDAQNTRVFDDDAQELTEAVVAQRIVTYRLTCDAITNTDTSWAWATIERIRTRLRRSRSADALLELNASLLRCLPSQEANFRAEARMHSRVSMDVQLLVRVIESDPEPLGWIQSVTISSDKIQDSDGTDLPASLQMTDVVVDGAGPQP